MVAASAHATDYPGQMAALVKRGAYLATASDCVACHTASRDKPFAGGLPISTPLGTIYSTNITPSITNGIGRYTEEDFSRALRLGVRRDGTHLYPAMPYTSYVRFTGDDVHALYAYFMHVVKPVDIPSPETHLPFPMNVRASMMFWNLLFLGTTAFSADPTHSVEWNRGAYLAEGAAHCSSCHTPRGFLMQEDSSRKFAGADVGAWHAPNITSDMVSGIGSWSQAELAEYLRTGKAPGKAQAAGSMGEAVEHSFQYLSAEDLYAIAAYVKSVPPISHPDDDRSRFAHGTMSSSLATLRGTDGIRSDNDVNPTGAQLFQGNCASCHAAEGEGSKDGYYPSLFNNSATGARNPTNLIAAILYGVDRTTSKEQAFMPGFGGKPGDANPLSDSEIALLGNYVLQRYGRADAHITEQDVAQVRRGGGSSNLVALTRVGIAVGAALLILIVLFVIFRKKNSPR
ncbi:c-type cytochrome [Burkholderia savannae]|uniref:c-type cytochrome n=1 Tax=Burkholderia savannae TaxID=1637837 RepID=UPI000AE92354|nr:cytochrome c [Burkholderia savannae]